MKIKNRKNYNNRNKIKTQDNIQQIQKHTFNHRNPNEYSSDTNLIKMRANGQATGVNGVNGTQQTQQTAQSNAKQEPKDNKTEQEPVRTYIPSPVGMVPQGPDMSAYSQAIATRLMRLNSTHKVFSK